MKLRFSDFARWLEKRRQTRLEEQAELLHIPKKRLLAMPKRYWYNPATWGRRVPLPPRKKISSVRQLNTKALRLIRDNWRATFGVTALYGLGLFIFVRSFDLSGLAVSDGSDVTGGWMSRLVGRAGTLLQNASTDISAASGAYQLIIVTVASLTLIWIFRHSLSHEKVRAKTALYNAPRPLVPYLLVLAWMGLQLIPLAIVGYLYSLLPQIYLLDWQMAIATTVLVLVAVWTLYRLIHSVFALFIVTLPDMTPMKALRSARKMVFRRRLLLWWKFLGGTLWVTLAFVLIMAPFLVWLPGLVPLVFFVLTVAVFTFGQAYLFSLYREIL